MSFSTFFSPFLKTGMNLLKMESPMIITRNLMKTHKGTAKRWRKTAHGFKRGIAGRKHGNSGWSQRSLKTLTGRKLAHPTHIKHLKRLLPFH